MKAGYFNINEYLEKLNEEAEGGQLPDKEGMVIPPENQKAYQWLKKEYQKAQTEVKVEINMGGAKFEPGYDLQTDLKSVKDFKPGMFGEVKTGETTEKEKKPADNLDAKKEKPGFQKGEGEKPAADKGSSFGKKPSNFGKDGDDKKEGNKESNFKTKGETKDIKKEDKDEEEPKEKDEKDSGEESKVKKIDLKTKKK